MTSMLYTRLNSTSDEDFFYGNGDGTEEDDENKETENEELEDDIKDEEFKEGEYDEDEDEI